MSVKRKLRLPMKLVSLFVTIAMIASLMTAIQPTASAYVETIGNVISASVNGDLVTLTVDNGAEANDDILEIQVCENDILKVNYRPNGIASSPSTPMIDPDRTWGSVGAPA